MKTEFLWMILCIPFIIILFILLKKDWTLSFNHKVIEYVSAFFGFLIIFMIILLFILVLFKNTIFRNVFLILVSILFIIGIIYKIIDYFMKRKYRKKEVYFRTIPEELTPCLASYIYNGKIQGKKEIFASMLDFFSKGIINISLKEHEYKCTPVENLRPYKKDEKYIYEYLTNSKQEKDMSLHTLEAIIREILLERDFLKEKNPILKWPFFILNVTLIIICALAGSFKWIPLSWYGPSMAFFVLFLFCIIYYYTKLIPNPSYRGHYKLTQKGREMQKKLLGFKKFMSDFSNIDKRKPKEIVLWKEYLVFAIALNVNLEYKNFKKDIPILNEYETQKVFQSIVHTLFTFTKSLFKEN